MEATIQDLGGTGRPFVMMNGYCGTQDINYVGIDDKLTGKVAAEHLIAKGRKHLAVLLGSKRSPISSSYLSGVRAGLSGTSVTITKELLEYSEYDVEVVEAIAARWFAGSKVPDGILAIDDQMVPPLYRAARTRGLTIGHDVAIISRGSAAFARSLEPNLTTIEISGHALGEKAAHMLLQSLREEHVPLKKDLLSSPLIINASA
jgi:LacI family transcriptional regulator